MTDMNLNQDILIGMLDSTYAAFKAVLVDSAFSIDAPAPAEGEWDARHVLSHIIGALNRTPIHAGFIIEGRSDVPVIFNDPYWQSEYQGAPKQSFEQALYTAVEGNKAFIRNLNPADLWKAVDMPQFGQTPLAVFLMVSYQKHVNEQHVPQLSAFLPVHA